MEEYSKAQSLLRRQAGYISHSDIDAELRAASSSRSSSSTLQDDETGILPYFDLKALWCQEANEEERFLDPAESDTKTLSANRIVHPTRSCRTSSVVYCEWIQHGKCWRADESGTRRLDEGDRGHPGVISRT